MEDSRKLDYYGKPNPYDNSDKYKMILVDVTQEYIRRHRAG